MTWSIVARDKHTGSYGCAVATKFFAVGAMCIKAEGKVGALATQALINPTFGPRGLRLLREGKSAGDVVKGLTDSDQGRGHRQLHVIDGAGNSAAYTGAACVDWCGHLLRDGFSVAGNMLAGPKVIEDTAQAFEANAALPLPRRLIAALKAGEAAGGDKRGKQSAALIVYSTEEYPELDLRVDDHADPLAELERLEAVSRERFTHFRTFLPTRANPSGVFDRATIEAGIAAGLSTNEPGDEP
jgi:uncharacterized Ntn-hydrolase superfamily protein